MTITSKNQFDHLAATFGARMVSSDRATRQQAAQDAEALLAVLPKFLSNSPHCADEISALRTLILRVAAEDREALTESEDGDWRIVSDGEIAVRVDMTHRERPMQYRLLYVEDAEWTGTPLQGADINLDPREAWWKVREWLRVSTPA